MERFGLSFTQKMSDDLLHMVRTAQVRVVLKQSLRVTVYDTTYNGTDLRFVFDHHRQQVATFLTLDMMPPSPFDDDADALDA